MDRDEADLYSACPQGWLCHRLMTGQGWGPHGHQQPEIALRGPGSGHAAGEGLRAIGTVLGGEGRGLAMASGQGERKRRRELRTFVSLRSCGRGRVGTGIQAFCKVTELHSWRNV